MSSSIDILSVKFPGYIPVEVCIAIGYMNPELRNEVWVRNTNLVFINIWVVAKAKITADIIQCKNRE